MSQKAPVLFIGHGSPMNAIEDTAASRGWRDIAQRFETPRAIACVSAHWLTEGVRVTAQERPRTIHDFRGFPQALFDVDYPAPGDPELAQRLVEDLSAFGAALDIGWGLDHGAWSVLRHMYPRADVPVLQLSLDAARTPEQHYALGQALGAVRDQGVLVLASGNIVHNLRYWREGAAQHWVGEFDTWIGERIAVRDDRAVIGYREHPLAAIAAPDWDHFVPLLYALGTSAGEPGEAFSRDLQPGIAMTCYAFGLA